MLSCKTCDIFKNTYFDEHLQTTASKHRSNFLEVFTRGCCSALINGVMEYSFSAALVQSWRSLYVNLLKTCPTLQVFFKEFYHRWRTALLKNASWWLFLRNNLFWKHSCMAASQRYLQTYIHFHILHFLLWRHVKEEQIFMIFFK